MQLGLSAILAFFVVTAGTGASPTSKRDVFSPPITCPNADTVWQTGEQYEVTWYVYHTPIL